MGRAVSQLILSLVDGVTKPARKAAESIGGISGAVAEGNRAQLGALAARQREQVRGLAGDLVGSAAAATAFGLALSAPDIIRKIERL